MSNDAVGPKVVFRHGVSGNHPRLTVCICFAVFLAACGMAVSKRGDWLPLALFCGLTAFLFSYVAYIKLEIWGTGFNHRDLLGNHTFEFGKVDDFLFETVRSDDGYAPVLSVKLRGGTERIKIPIGMFPIRASALLLVAVDRHRIPIRLDGSPLVLREMQEISEAQSKFLQQEDREAIRVDLS